MSIIDQVKNQNDTVFNAQDRFEETITYTPFSGSSSSFKANVTDEFDLTDDGGLDTDFVGGLAHVIHVYVSETDVVKPVYRDTVTWNSSTYTVKQVRSQVGMWHLLCSDDQRMPY